MRTRWTVTREHEFVSRVATERVRNLRALCEAPCTPTGVDVATGRVLVRAIDASTPGALPIVFERFYASSWSHRMSPLGWGWSHAYDQALYSEPGRLVWLAGDGREIEFDVFALRTRTLRTGDEISDMRGEATLRAKGAGEYRVETADGMQYHFAPAGAETPTATFGKSERCAVLAHVKNRAGSEITIERDRRGNVVGIRNSAGRALRLDYDDADRLRNLMTVIGPRESVLVCSYGYSPAGDLVVVAREGGAPARYLYTSHLLTRQIDAGGFAKFYGYDDIGSAARCIETWGTRGSYHTQFSYSPRSRLVTWTDALGAKYSAQSDVVNAIKRWGKVDFAHDSWFRTVSAEDTLGAKHAVEYDTQGRPTDVSTPSGARIRIRYDGRGHPESIRDACGGEWQWRFDLHGQLAEETDPLGQRVVYESAGGLVRSIAAPARGKHEFTYDTAEQLVRVVRPDGSEVAIEYDLRGRIERVVDPTGFSTRIEYDKNGFVTSVVGDDGFGKLYLRDAMGRLQEFRAAGSTIRWKYMFDGWVSARRENDGRERACRYNARGQLATVRSEIQDYAFLHFDKFGYVEREVGFDGATRRYAHDVRGRVKHTVLPGKIKVSFARDASGNVIKVTPKDGRVEKYGWRPDGLLETAEVAGTKVAIERDAVGRIVKETQGDFWVETVYDAAGDRLETRSSLGARFVYMRDAMGRVTAAWVGEPQRAQWRVDLAYDRAGREAQRAFPGGVLGTWERDSAGRVLKHTIIAQGKPFIERAYAWDAMGQSTGIVDTRFGPMMLEYDECRRLRGWTEGTTRIERGLDAVNDVFRTRYGSDADYTSGGRIKRSGNVHYRHDLRGFIVSAKSDDGQTWSYEWTHTGLLAKAKLPDGRIASFEYDAFGRRTKKTVGQDATVYVWDGNVILHEVSSGEGVTTWMWLPGTFSLLAKIKNGRYFGVVTDQIDAPLALFDANATPMWSGHITPWGGAIRDSSRTRCPWRFAGYYQDDETMLLSARHRYYAPLLGRYFTPHPLGLHGGTNPFCFVDDPVWQSDPWGLLDVSPRRGDETAMQSLIPQSNFLVGRIRGDIAASMMHVDDFDAAALVKRWVQDAPRTNPSSLDTHVRPVGWQAPPNVGIRPRIA